MVSILSLLKDNIYNIVLNLLLLLLLFSILFPVDKSLSKICRRPILKVNLFLFFIPLILLLIAKVDPLGFLISLFLITFSLFIFMFGFISDKKHIYTLALVSLVLTSIMLITKMGGLAEFFAQVCFLSLVLGVLKDIFYEKIFK